MVAPTIFSEGGAARVAKFTPQGVLADKGTATLPAATAADTIVGLVRFQAGCNILGLSVVSEDLDTATDTTLDIGIVYDDTIEGSDNPDAFFDGIDIVQDAGSVIWPTADGLLTGVGYVTTGKGWIVAQPKGASTNTEGDITLQALFSYDN